MTPKIVTHKNVHKWANHLKYFSQYGISTVRCTRQFFFFFFLKERTDSAKYSHINWII